MILTSFKETLAEAVDHLANYPTTTSLAVRLLELQERLDTGRFHLAVLGQFKRGKSTLLNALLGEAFLPMAVVPLTAIPTLIEHGAHRKVQVVFQNGQTEIVPPTALDKYVTETGNPGNHLAVSHVAVHHPAPLLARGVVLIDTPGIGSTLTHNTETTMDFLTEVDAAIFLVSADPPLTATELAFLQTIRQKVKHLFFLLNKVDYLTPTEQSQIMDFLATTLREQAGLDEGIFPVSARLALKARQEADVATWEASGLDAIEKKLLYFLDNDKQVALQSALASKTTNILNQAIHLLQTERLALTMPLDSLQEKHHAFQQALLIARQERQRADDLLAGDQTRILTAINKRAKALKEKALIHLRQIVRVALDEATNPTTGEALAQERLAEGAAAFFAAQQEGFSQALYQQMTTMLVIHAEAANNLTEQMRRLAADLFAFNFMPLSSEELPARPQQPYWVTSTWIGGLGLPVAPSTWERLMPTKWRRQRVLDRLEEVVEKLSTQNTENLRWSVVQNSEQILHQFKKKLDAHWVETIEATAAVLDTVITQRQRQSNEVVPALDRLDHLIETIQVMMLELTPDSFLEQNKGVNHEYPN